MRHNSHTILWGYKIVTLHDLNTLCYLRDSSPSQKTCLLFWARECIPVTTRKDVGATGEEVLVLSLLHPGFLNVYVL